MPMANVEVGWEVAPDPAFRTIARTGTTLARPELGHSVHVEVSGLESGSRRTAMAVTCRPSGNRRVPDNPHIKCDAARRGYIACTATPRALQADFRILQGVAVPNQPIRTGGSLVVEAGRPGCSIT